MKLANVMIELAKISEMKLANVMMLMYMSRRKLRTVGSQQPWVMQTAMPIKGGTLRKREFFF